MSKMNKGKLALVLTILKEEFKQTLNGFNVLGFIHENTSAVVELKGITYFMWDNGGELGIKEVNSNEYAGMIPLTRFQFELDTLTIVYRCKQYFNGLRIDYDYKENKETVKSYFEFLRVTDVNNYSFN